MHDPYCIQDRLKEVYPDLSVSGGPGRYTVRREEHALVRLGRGLWASMTRAPIVVTWQESMLDARLIHHMRYTDMWSGHRNALQELEAEEYEEERSAQRDHDRMTEEFAKDAQRALQHDLGLA